MPVALTPSVRRRTSTAAGLSILSFFAYHAQHRGWTAELPDPAQAVAESLAHPALGYIGAWIGVRLGNRSPLRVQERAAVAVGTVVNFAAEAAQDVIDGTAHADGFLDPNHLPETAKDYVFALAGIGWYLKQNVAAEQSTRL
jgi:hypothetical protein